MSETLPAESMTTPTAAAVYGHEYQTWKNWHASDFGQPTRYQRHYFPAELANCGKVFPAGSRVLEMGFGNGAFMAWGKAQGWHMQGTEMIAPLVKLAQDAGFQALCTQTLDPLPDAQFDLVVAFDVLEHIPQAQLPDVLLAIKRVLRPGGVLLARFPNADSPFGLGNQHGDPTHVTALGSGKVIYLCRQVGAELTHLGGEAEPMWVGWSLTSAQHVLAAPVKLLAKWMVRLVFLPHARIAFFSPNLAMACHWPERPARDEQPTTTHRT